MRQCSFFSTKGQKVKEAKLIASGNGVHGIISSCERLPRRTSLTWTDLSTEPEAASTIAKRRRCEEIWTQVKQTVTNCCVSGGWLCLRLCSNLPYSSAMTYNGCKFICHFSCCPPCTYPAGKRHDNKREIVPLRKLAHTSQFKLVVGGCRRCVRPGTGPHFYGNTERVTLVGLIL